MPTPRTAPAKRVDRKYLRLFIPVFLAALVIAFSWILLEPVTAVISCGLGLAMLAIAFADARSLRIPDTISLPAIPAGLVAAGYLAPANLWYESVLEHATAALLACGLLYGVARAYRLYRNQEGLGLGDVKLGAAAGAWTGTGAAMVILLACAAALLFVVARLASGGESISRSTVVPLGVFLAASTWVIWLAQMMGWLG